VDDATSSTPHQRVPAWHHAEVNHLRLAMQGNGLRPE
jgi:hypothetical protein